MTAPETRLLVPGRFSSAAIIFAAPETSSLLLRVAAFTRPILN
jgi:hypothetical protein